MHVSHYFIDTFFFFRAELDLEASGVSVAPSERAHSVRASLLPHPPAQPATRQ
jgi:hypothetical protein